MGSMPSMDSDAVERSDDTIVADDNAGLNPDVRAKSFNGRGASTLDGLDREGSGLLEGRLWRAQGEVPPSLILLLPISLTCRQEIE